MNIDAKLSFEDGGHEFILGFFKERRNSIPADRTIELSFNLPEVDPDWLPVDDRIYIQDIWDSDGYEKYDDVAVGNYGFAVNPDPDGGFVFLLPVYEGSDAIDSPDFPMDFFEENYDNIEEVIKAREMQTTEWKDMVKALVDYIEDQEDPVREVFGKDLIWP